ncbi:MAG TPA: ABC transporter transmembrane domain-containing protein [Pseudomonas sp.]
MAVEPQTARKWDNQLAAYVAASFKTQNLSAIANESVGLVGKLVTVATLWLGARLVIEGDLTVGHLIALAVRAEVITDTRRVISYFLSPLKQYAHESLSER